MTFDDPYLDQAAGVLRNRLDITDAGRLCQAEADMSYLRDQELKQRPLPGRYDLAHLAAFHRRIFGDVYDWAGELRRVDVARTAPFAHWRHIESYGGEILTKLADEKLLAGLDRDVFLDRFTHYFSEVNALHPFREGNGRTQRAFFRQLGLQAGWRVDFALVDREEYLDACRESMTGPTGPLRSVFAQALVGPAC